MEEKDFIKDLFADKLANAQAPVNPELWSAISSKIGASSVVSTGLSTTAKWLIGLGTAASVTVATVLLTNNDSTPIKEKAPKTELVSNELVSDKDSTQNESTHNNMDSIDDFKLNIVPFSYNNDGNPWLGMAKVIFPDGLDDKIEKDSIIRNELIIKEELLEETNLKENTVVKPDSSQNIVVKSSFELKELPNVFTLNNDGKNDYFFIEMKGIEDFVLTVLNSKNEVVYSAVDADFKWDGRDKQGNLVDSGAYVYFFTGKDLQGNPVSKHNSLRIIVK